MLQKLEKSFQPAQRMANMKSPMNFTADQFLVNQRKMTVGLAQRLNVQPENLLPSQNKSRIGVHVRGGREYNLNGDWAYVTTPTQHGRRVRVYQPETNKMQSTPYTRSSNYVMQIENTGFSRSHGMNWSRASNDPWHRYGDRNEIYFNNIETAFLTARSLGFEVDVIYSHERYHEQKSYADNFVYAKENVEDIDSMDEISIENLMKKL